jgi:hypothetical protein
MTFESDPRRLLGGWKIFEEKILFYSRLILSSGSASVPNHLLAYGMLKVFWIRALQSTFVFLPPGTGV